MRNRAMPGGPCTAHAKCMGSAGAPRGARVPLPPAFHGGVYRHRQAGGKGSRNPQGSSTCSAALVDYDRLDRHGGIPLVPVVLPRQYHPGQNEVTSTASLTECWGPRLDCARRKSWKSAQEPEKLQITQYTALQSSMGRQGLTSTKLELKSHWTVEVTWTELLCSRDHARQDERGYRGPVMQSFGACVSRGKIPSTHRRFLQSFWCRVKAGYSQSMHHLKTVEKAGRMRRYNVAGSRLATVLWFSRCPGAASGRSLVEVEEGDAEELW
ncbi:hypothetical protein NDU88_002152 [Pleurodeles waltl]|uniref:Uncharacterized protein n=1 Tax=Pleurodeles waltl TaxID=8319 RepID=A0AAV7NH68_PLEWA|nr:hypothetical protein NDU88_002152 [Pleurodeles waltl]